MIGHATEPCVSLIDPNRVLPLAARSALATWLYQSHREMSGGNDILITTNASGSGHTCDRTGYRQYGDFLRLLIGIRLHLRAELANYFRLIHLCQDMEDGRTALHRVSGRVPCLVCSL